MTEPGDVPRASRWASLGVLTAPGETTPARHRFAILLITLSSVGFSFAGLIIRSIETATIWQLNFYRSFFMGLLLLALAGAQYGRGLGRVFRRIGPLGLIASFLIGIAPIFYVFAMTETTVANALFIIATVPFFTAVLAWLFLAERVRTGTWVAMAAAAAGILVMVGEGLAVGSLFGNAMALLVALLFSCFAVIVRRQRDVDLLPALVLGALFTCVVSLFATGGALAISTHDLLLCLVWGAGISGLVGNWLFIKAARHLAAAEVTLLMMTEFVLGPIWVWLFVAEVPGRYTLIGGALVLGAVAGRAISDIRARPG